MVAPSLLLALIAGCRTVPPLPPENLSEPGWTVRQGQAVWIRARNEPEIAGEILVAIRGDGRAFVQFSKNPFPLVIARSTSESWEVQTPTQNKRYSGHGNPPARLVFLQIPRALVGLPLARGWSWGSLPNSGFSLANAATGESLEIYFSQ